MKLIVVFGPPAVGKLTIANELSELTGYPVLHNHATLDLVKSFFEFASKPFLDTVRAMRILILKEALKQKLPGIILTTGYTNTRASAVNFLKLKNLIQKNNGQIYFIQLTCSRKQLFIRVKAKEHRRFGKLITKKGLKKAFEQWDFFSQPPHIKTLSINTSKLSATFSAKKILNYIRN